MTLLPLHLVVNWQVSTINIVTSHTAVFIRPISTVADAVTDVRCGDTAACAATSELVFTACYTHSHKTGYLDVWVRVTVAAKSPSNCETQGLI